MGNNDTSLHKSVVNSLHAFLSPTKYLLLQERDADLGKSVSNGVVEHRGSMSLAEGVSNLASCSFADNMSVGDV